MESTTFNGYKFQEFTIDFNDKDKSIILRKDDINWTTAYNTGKRGYKKARAMFERDYKNGEIAFETTFYELKNMFDTAGMKMRSYCGLD